MAKGKPPGFPPKPGGKGIAPDDKPIAKGKAPPAFGAGGGKQTNPGFGKKGK